VRKLRDYFPKQHRHSVFVLGTLTGQTGDGFSSKLMVYLKRENYATEVVFIIS
jgi:hypothetical protein